MRLHHFVGAPPPKASPATPMPGYGGRPSRSPRVPLEGCPISASISHTSSQFNYCFKKGPLTLILGAGPGSGTHAFLPLLFQAGTVARAHLLCVLLRQSSPVQAPQRTPDQCVRRSTCTQPVCRQHVTEERVQAKLNCSQASGLPNRAPRGLEMVRWPFKNQQ